MADWVTQRDIAEALGLEVSTVSKALGNHPQIAAATRERVSRKAAELGYRRDPMLAALANYRGARKGSGYRATLGWIYNHGKRARMERFAAYGDYLNGARLRAGQLGYQLEEFWVDGKNLTERRLAGVLKARGIAGVVIAPQLEAHGSMNLPWDRLSAVTIGYTLRKPQLHMVSNDHYQTLTQLFECLQARGCARPGIYLWYEDNRRMQSRVVAAVANWSVQHSIPVLAYESAEPKALADWVRAHRLDAVVTREDRTRDWLLQAGMAAASLPLLASYALDGTGGRINCGMTHHNDRIGAAAVDWLARMVEHAETGLPDLPCRLLLPGTWREPDPVEQCGATGASAP